MPHTIAHRPSPARRMHRAVLGAALLGMATLSGCSLGDALDMRGEQPVPGKLLRAMKACTWKLFCPPRSASRASA